MFTFLSGTYMLCCIHTVWQLLPRATAPPRSTTTTCWPTGLCRFLEVSFFPWLFVIKPYLTYQYGGIELVTWTIAVPMVAGWHSTFLVNSAAHVYGRQPYETGKLCTASSCRLGTFSCIMRATQNATSVPPHSLMMPEAPAAMKLTCTRCPY